MRKRINKENNEPDNRAARPYPTSTSSIESVRTIASFESRVPLEVTENGWLAG